METDAARNENIVRSFYAAMGDRDVKRALELLDDNVVLHIAGDSPIGGDHVGKEAAIALLSRVQQETEGTFRLQLLDVLANESYAVTRHLWTATRRGRNVSMNNFNVYRVTSGGRINERWEFLADDAVHDEFWS